MCDAEIAEEEGVVSRVMRLKRGERVAGIRFAEMTFVADQRLETPPGRARSIGKRGRGGGGEGNTGTGGGGEREEVERDKEGKRGRKRGGARGR